MVWQVVQWIWLLAHPYFSIKADIIAAALDTVGGHHLLGALPTGYGKSLPMMVLALLLFPGNESVKTIGHSQSCSWWLTFQCMFPWLFYHFLFFIQRVHCHGYLSSNCDWSTTSSRLPAGWYQGLGGKSGTESLKLNLNVSWMKNPSCTVDAGRVCRGNDSWQTCVLTCSVEFLSNKGRHPQKKICLNGHCPLSSGPPPLA